MSSALERCRHWTRLQQYLQGPKAEDLLRVILPYGHILQGQLIDGCTEPGGGWPLINVG